MTLGERLSSLRKKKGFSQEQLAEELGLTRQTVSKWELDQSAPDISYILKLSEFFSVSTDYIIKGTDSFSSVENKGPVEKENTSDSGGIKDSRGKIYTWCFFAGSVISGVSLAGIIAFVICSALNPWGALVGGLYFEGLFGFLFGTGTFWFFVILSVLFISGLVTLIYALVKNIGRKN